LPCASSPRFSLEVADIENSKFKLSTPNKCLTMVVFPEPEGAENTMSLPCFLFLLINRINVYC